MAVASTQLELNAVWLRRWNQDIEAALNGLARLRHKTGWRLQAAHELLEVQPAHYDEYFDALLLRASLLRAQSRKLESSALLAKLDRANDQLGHRRSFRLHFELGIDHWISDDIHQALESFLAADALATTKVERVFATSNILWCLEALDIDRARVERKLAARLKLAPQALHVRQQFQAYRLRQMFYHGDLRRPPRSMGQGEFFTAWCASLPYLQLQASLKKSRTFPFSSIRSLWQGSYRHRTLTLTFVPNERVVRVSDAIDRLYLWTWRWMNGDAQSSLEMIEATLASVLADLETGFLSIENQLLLRNSLAWLNLLAPRLLKNLRKLLHRLESVKSSNYPLLEIEYELALTFPENTSSCQFYQLSRIGTLRRLREFADERHRLRSIDNYDVVVDHRAETVSFCKSGQRLVSPPLAKLFALISRKDSFTIEDLDLGEDRPGHNLLARAKRLWPTLRVELRSGLIRVKGGAPRVLILHESKTASDVPVRVEPDQLRFAKRLTSAKAVFAVFQRDLTRSDLERTFKVSKATACRLLQTWIRNGSMVKEGKGKGIKYLWNLDALRSLS